MTPSPNELDALIRAARDVAGPPPEVAARLIERLDAAPAAAVPAAAISKGALVLGGAGLLLVGALAGGGAVWSLREPQPSPAPIQIVVAAPAPAPAPAPMDLEAEPADPPPDEPKVVARPVARPVVAPESTLEAERRLLEGARAAVVSGAFNDALAAVAAHAVRFPNGALAEEREAIAVQALAATDRAAALARAEAFRRRWPSSIFEPVIEKIAPRDGSRDSPQ